MFAMGRRGNGKTTLAVHVADRSRRRLMIDPRGLVRRPGSIVVRAARRLPETIEALAEGDVDDVVYTPAEDHAEAFASFAAQLRRWILDHPKKSLAVVIDEASFYEGDRLKAFGDFRYVVKSCDLDKVRLLVTAHRPTDVHPDIVALADRLCFFRTTLTRDLDIVRAQCGDDVAAIAARLEPRQFVEWNNDDATYRTHRHPVIWFTELKPRGASARITEVA